MDVFLEEQLRRIQELTKKVTGWERHTAEPSDDSARERERVSRNPLSDVRDLRTVSSSRSTRERSHAHDMPRHRRRRKR